jgi:serine phosphatase RsbU (regulator of sigma subunit)
LIYLFKFEIKCFRLFKFLMLKRHSFLLILSLLFVWKGGSAIPDSLINLIEFKDEKYNVNFSIGRNLSSLSILNPKWIFINEDNPELRFCTGKENNYFIVSDHASNKEEDISVQTVNSFSGRIFKNNFSGIGWYKCYFKIPSGLIRKVFELEFALHGAAEVYLDGHLEKSFGEINADPLLAKEVNVTDGSVYFSIKDTAMHCIAIRFGLPNHSEYYRKYSHILQEPMFQFSMPELKEGSSTMLSIYYSITNMLSAFFLSLFIIHFLIYIFYREQFFNLLYSLFLILLSLTFLEAYLTQFIENLRFYLWLENIDDVVFPTVCFILVTLLNKLLNEKRSWHYVFLIILLLYHYVDVIFIGEYSRFTKVSIVMYTYFNTLAHSIKGVRRKIASAKFLGWGILTCTISILLMIITTLTIAFTNINVTNDGMMVFIYSFLIIVTILSIPISMSAYLAFDFANTNKSLSSKLIEVEELSAKNLEQEQEKQRILASQNEVLEIQVKERTHEIEEQKKIIEEKNKDITDSITYAERIQRSILPSIQEIKALFPESFVLFKPRDIVSGDFYQFKKKDDLHFAIMADCTGHGVPGALMSMIGSNLLHQIIVERGITQPNLILSELHKEVRRTLRQTQGVSSHDGMDISILVLHQNRLYLASANRPVYLMHNGDVQEIKPTKLSIGGSSVAEELQYDLVELPVVAGQMVYLFSDGYADQFGGEAGKKFKVKNLMNLLLEVHQKPLEEQYSILDEHFENWKGTLEQVDDVTLIGIRV